MPYDIFNTKSALNYKNLKFIYKKYGGPVWVYEAEKIINQINKLKNFDVIRFAQKACSNINILKLIRKQGVKIDSVSLGEIERALLAGFNPTEDINSIIFTSDILEISTLKRIIELGIPVNIGSVDMLEQLGRCSPGHKIWLRINPGFGEGHNFKTNTGGKNSKHGIWYTDLLSALFYIRYYRLQLIGLHMHIGSGVNYIHLTKVCDAMVNQVESLNQDIESISAGGGLSIPYKYEEKSIDYNHYFNIWDSARRRISKYLGHHVKLEIEPGRFIVAEAGVLVAQVRTVKKIDDYYFVLVDVGFNDLIRPVMYGSYHHISIIPSDDRDIKKQKFRPTIVGGPLCESGDVFTQNAESKILPRNLPVANVGDYIIFHDTGAYGSSMSSNYNSRLLIPEVLFYNGKIFQIRRRQKFDELFSLEKIYEIIY